MTREPSLDGVRAEIKAALQDVEHHLRHPHRRDGEIIARAAYTLRWLDKVMNELVSEVEHGPVFDDCELCTRAAVLIAEHVAREVLGG